MAVLAAVSCGPTKLDTAPEELIGRWVGSADYAGAFLHIRSTGLSIGTLDGNSTSVLIDSIEVESTEQATTYHLRYLDPMEGALTLHLSLLAGDADNLRLANKLHVAFARASGP